MQIIGHTDVSVHHVTRLIIDLYPRRIRSILDHSRRNQRVDDQAERDGQRYRDCNAHADTRPLRALLDTSSDGGHYPGRLGKGVVVNVCATNRVRMKRESLVIQVPKQGGKNFSVLQLAMNELVFVDGESFYNGSVLIRR